jgi:hypothetical protein
MMAARRRMQLTYTSSVSVKSPPRVTTFRQRSSPSCDRLPEAKDSLERMLGYGKAAARAFGILGMEINIVPQNKGHSGIRSCHHRDCSNCQSGVNGFETLQG